MRAASLQNVGSSRGSCPVSHITNSASIATVCHAFVLAGKPSLSTIVFLEIASLRSDAGDATETGLKVEEPNDERATVTTQIIKFGVIEQHPGTLISMDQYISDPTTVKTSAVQHLKPQRQTPPSITGVSERREERRIFDIEHSALLAEFMWQKIDVGASLPTVREKGVPYTDQHKTPLLRPVLASSEDLSTVFDAGNVECTLCQKQVEKKLMRTHSGVHLRVDSARIQTAQPCGLCLGGRCVAYLQRRVGTGRPQPAACCRLLAPGSLMHLARPIRGRASLSKLPVRSAAPLRTRRPTPCCCAHDSTLLPF